MPGTASPSAVADIRVLSAGAPKTGVSRCAEAFFGDTGHKVDITFATAPVIRGRVADGAAPAEVVIAPVPAMQEFEENGRTVAGVGAVIGSVKVGVAVRDGAPEPDISSAEAFKNAVLAADSLVYNEASSGLYMARLMERLGIADKVGAKTTRLPTGAAVMQHVAQSHAANEIGFGQITEIRLFAGKSVKLVGPLPPEIGKVITYAAGLLSDARAPDPSTAFIRFLASPAAKRTLVATGVE
ncbi:MAG: molybdate ABC transporter substrate-binding protein [Kiloniellaceae bacterium]